MTHWASLTPDEKREFEVEAEELRAKYKQEMQFLKKDLSQYEKLRSQRLRELDEFNHGLRFQGTVDKMRAAIQELVNKNVKNSKNTELIQELRKKLHEKEIAKAKERELPVVECVVAPRQKAGVQRVEQKPVQRVEQRMAEPKKKDLSPRKLKQTSAERQLVVNVADKKPKESPRAV